MAFTVDVDFSRKFDVDASIDTVFDVLSNVPESASYFPNVERLVDLGSNAFRWEMKKIGVGELSIQTIYASKYESDREKGTVRWSPVPGEGNAEVKGNWKLTDKGDKCECRLSTNGVMEVPLPRLVKMAVAPIVVNEFQRMVDKYVESLIKGLPKLKSSKAAEAPAVKKEAAPKKESAPPKKAAAPVKKAAVPAKKAEAKKTPAKKKDSGKKK